VPSDLFYDEIRLEKFSLTIIVHRAKFKFEVLFEKFLLRISLITLVLSMTYLLNTITPISDHENCSLGKTSKTFLRGIPLGFQASKFLICRVGPKYSGSPKFQPSIFYGPSCGPKTKPFFFKMPTYVFRAISNFLMIF
jgi:hypothetical protein